ncbi:Ig-like domain-containing protein [Actinoplanes derwentensis]|uniref:Ig-like domain (Group 3) n=1 Tax=Actinoplanes derwentensis TaxID=113562 RepID=A0A1H1RTY7_9ACTN|nr:Ig-like domain-containing protein [Actinoplanes derwentensis]SDS39140.1 Ig-like domain (group 3) [Actinoplanes derwentensis]
MRAILVPGVLAGVILSTVASPVQAAQIPWWDAISAPGEYSTVHGVTPVTFAADPDLAAVQLDGGPVTALDGDGPWTTTVDLSRRPSGSQSFTVWLTYRDGSRAVVSWTVVVDNDRPVIQDGTKQLLFNSDVSFEPTVSDTSDRVRVDLLVDGKVEASDPYAPYYLPLAVYGRRNGSHRLTLRATDPFGQSSEINRTVVVDTIGPSVTGLTPAHRSFVRGTFTVKATKVSDAYGVAYAELYVDGKFKGRDTTAPYGVKVTTKDASWYRWNVVDKAGNITSIERHIFVDTQAPTIRKLKAPKNKARVYGKVTVTLQPEDDFGTVPRAELLVNGKVVAKATKFPYRLTVDTRRQKKTMKVQIRVYDKAGNTTTTKTRIWKRR